MKRRTFRLHWIALLCWIGLLAAGCTQSDPQPELTRSDSQPAATTPEQEVDALPSAATQPNPPLAATQLEPPPHEATKAYPPDLAPPEPLSEVRRYVGQHVIVRSPEIRARVAPTDDAPEINQTLEMDLCVVVGARGKWLRIAGGWLHPEDVILLENPVDDLTAELDRGPSAPALVRRSTAWQSTGDLEMAEADANAAVRLEPQSAGCYCARGKIRERLAKAGAMQDYERAIELRPDYADALAGRASILFGSGQWRRAIADATKAIELDPVQPWYYVTRCQARMSLYEFDDAILDAAKAIELVPNISAAYELRAQIFIIRQDYENALLDCNEAIRLCGEKSVQGFIFRGTVHQKRQDWEQAATDYGAVIRISPESNLGYLLRGNVYLASRQYEAAIPDLTRAIEITPTLAEAYERRAHAYYMAGMHDESERDRHRAIRLVSQVRAPVSLPASATDVAASLEPSDMRLEGPAQANLFDDGVRDIRFDPNGER